mmetsp:Transcript_22651/g.26279  ORF Transcript_22651/g.26279 Transcript_22651/m.26279 type:complete len:320 (-) Transcript_22651:60-1019(-)
MQRSSPAVTAVTAVIMALTALINNTPTAGYSVFKRWDDKSVTPSQRNGMLVLRCLRLRFRVAAPMNDSHRLDRIVSKRMMRTLEGTESDSVNATMMRSTFETSVNVMPLHCTTSFPQTATSEVEMQEDTQPHNTVPTKTTSEAIPINILLITSLAISNTPHLHHRRTCNSSTITQGGHISSVSPQHRITTIIIKIVTLLLLVGTTHHHHHRINNRCRLNHSDFSTIGLTTCSSNGTQHRIETKANHPHIVTRRRLTQAEGAIEWKFHAVVLPSNNNNNKSVLLTDRSVAMSLTVMTGWSSEGETRCRPYGDEIFLFCFD